MAELVKITVRMYQVGFGDCFLLSFDYAEDLDDGRRQRHILIDMGTTHPPRPGFQLKSVAELIRDHCDGRLDVIVATHRHKDHISGFGQDALGEILTALKPRLVVRPWTEDPEVDETAVAPSPTSPQAFRQLLASGHNLAASLGEKLHALPPDAASDELLALAFDQLKNLDAIKQLDKWGADAKATYVFAGSDSGIEDIVPGLKVHVLGPPTMEQHPRVARQRSNHPEYWFSLAGLVDGISHLNQRGERVDQQEEPLPLGPVRRLVPRLQRQMVEGLLNVVRTIDDALNNTSLILLFEAGPKRLLFPGDAQIENWEFALGREEDITLLRGIDFYKVGHHGSRNATPRTLFNLWEAPNQLVVMLSTMEDVHGKTEATAVPRSTLVEALEGKAQADFYTTHRLEDGVAFIELAADLQHGGRWQRVP